SKKTYKHLNMNRSMSLVMLLAILVSVADAAWEDAHATFYGDISGKETMQGACGYGDLFQKVMETAALSTALFNNGQTCGACFELTCVNSQWCKQNAESQQPTSAHPTTHPPVDIHWCNPPNKHFDLSMKMFTSIAEYKSGIVPVKFRRVKCQKRGGVRFEVKGNPNFIMVLVYNVGGAGDVNSLAIKGIRVTGSLCRGTGGRIGTLVRTKTLVYSEDSDGRSLTFYDVASESWGFGQTFEAKSNFY
ncbi:LOW QUALITY PROTEIN: hypothetical protein HID58_093093, partial [Brassica napus]